MGVAMAESRRFNRRAAAWARAKNTRMVEPHKMMERLVLAVKKTYHRGSSKVMVDSVRGVAGEYKIAWAEDPMNWMLHLSVTSQNGKRLTQQISMMELERRC